jgi:adenylosuccinate lyase
MAEIWSLENMYQTWLQVELAACEAQAELGNIPEEALATIREHAGFDVARIAEVEAEARHDMIAFLTSLSEQVGEPARYIHMGMTSSDVKDTALALQIRQALNLLLDDVRALGRALKAQALRYRDQPMIGRSHGIHAEPTTWGLKLANWAFEVHRNGERLTRAREIISVGKISGVVGTYAHFDPQVEALICERLGLMPAPVSTQIVQRDRHAEVIWAAAVTAAGLERYATEIRHLQRTELREVEEPFTKGQKGSSAMPHKRNPILSERLSGQARLFRGYLNAALENIPLWHERDMSHSSVERVILPDATTLLDYMLSRFTWLVENMVVRPERMAHNLQLTGGIINSERVLLALVEKGVERDVAYRWVQRAAMAAWEGEADFRQALLDDERVAARLTEEELDIALDSFFYLRHVDTIMTRLERLSF